jgi:hypothetical protein
MPAKRGKTKKLKDLDPKGRGKGVRGGRTNLNTHVGNVTKGVGTAINNTGGMVNDALNP